MSIARTSLFIFILCITNISLVKGELKVPILVNVNENMEKLLESEDTDNDNKITVDDKGDKVFYIESITGRTYKVESTYYLSNVLMQLSLDKEKNKQIMLLRPYYIYENPVDRTSRMIRELFWDGLTRRIDEEHLAQVLKDEKIESGHYYLYVPYNDTDGYTYFSNVASNNKELNMKVELLPEIVSPEYVRDLGDEPSRHGLLSLAIEENDNGIYEGVPFVVPGGRFNEMYGWDSYFINRGLLLDNKLDLAMGMVKNFMYEIEYYGKILNANRTYYLTRSQPPFFTSMFIELNNNVTNNQLLYDALNLAIKEYKNVWMARPKLTDTGLSRYYGTGLGIPPETEEGHYDWLLKGYADRYNMSIEEFEKMYNQGAIDVPGLDEYFIHDRCMRESGHDTTYRWTVDGEDRCADFVTVDLNSLLYKYEIDIASVIDNYFNGSVKLYDGTITTSEDWYIKANNRKKLILNYLWDEEKKLFFDYNIVDNKRSDYVSATTFYPLWAIHPDDESTYIIDNDKAKQLVQKALSYLEEAGGIAATAKESAYKAGQDILERQWDYPFGWAPHQMIAWRALLNYGFKEEAHRLIYKWLYTITKNATDYNGTIPEKYNVVTRSHKVFISYGNVGTEFDYITTEGFGWMNASYQEGLSLLPNNLIEKLKDLIPPEDIF